MTPPLELHGAQTGNCFRAAIALEEAGIAYQVHVVDLAQGEQGKAAHLALNPSGKVPTLVDRARAAAPFVLSQSNAIIFHAADLAPGRLIPLGDAMARARVYERFFYFVTDVIAVNHGAFQLRRANQPDAAQLLEQRSLEALAFANRYLASATFVAADVFSMADIAAFTIALACRSQLEWARLPNLKRWFDAVATRPSVVKGLKAFG